MCLVCISGCGKEKKDTKQASEGSIQVYFIASEKTQLVSQTYELKNKTDKVKAVKELLDAMRSLVNTEQYKKAIPDQLTIKKVEEKKGHIVIDFDAAYGDMDIVTELFCRAAIVKTVVQIDGVYDVEFTVNEQPLMNKDEQAIGVMDEGSFLEDQENISNYNEYSYITIYFSDSTGKKLKEYNEQIEFEPNVPVEQIVMNQLLNGPQEKGYKDTIPKGTKVNSVVTKEGICYIDLSSEFLAQQEGVSPEVVIYSVVNSLAELPTVNKVQFTVNGEKVKKYQKTVTFSGVIERNLEIVEQ